MNTNFQVIGLTRLESNPSLQLKRQTLYTTRSSELLFLLSSSGLFFLYRAGVCKLRPASRNRAAREGLHFFSRMRPVNASHVFLKYLINSMSQIERFKQNTLCKENSLRRKIKAQAASSYRLDVQQQRFNCHHQKHIHLFVIS